MCNLEWKSLERISELGRRSPVSEGERDREIALASRESVNRLVILTGSVFFDTFAHSQMFKTATQLIKIVAFTRTPEALLFARFSLSLPLSL